MQLTIDYKEIEALILAKTGLEISIRYIDTDEIRFQPRNMGFIHNRVKVSLKIDREYSETNRIKLIVSAGVFSNIVVPKVMALLDYMPDGSVARQGNGIVYILFDKMPQMEKILSYCDITDICFYHDFISVKVGFSDMSGVNVNDIPPDFEDSWSSSTSYKDREIGNTFTGIARAIFESDKVDEGILALRDKANELKDVHGDELWDAALSWLQKKSTSDTNGTQPD